MEERARPERKGRQVLSESLAKAVRAIWEPLRENSAGWLLGVARVQVRPREGPQALVLSIERDTERGVLKI